MKRFYKQAASAPVGQGFGVLLDGKAVKTPAGKGLEVPTAALAAALAEEWEAQQDEVRPSSMPLMQLVSTALDRIPVTRAQVVDYVAGFGGSDLLCYRAEAPSDLTLRQAEHWQPWLDWAARELDAPLRVTSGVVPVRQPDSSLAALRRKIEAHDVWVIAALQSAVPALGSLVLALALTDGELTFEQAFELSQLDEMFQAERWGLDAEAQARQAGLRREIMAAARLLDLLKAA